VGDEREIRLKELLSGWMGIVDRCKKFNFGEARSRGMSMASRLNMLF
jgi:hypothetical protein